MPPTRRHFFHSLFGLSGLAALPAAAPAAGPARPDVYRTLGLRPLINAAGTYTVLGGSLMPPAVVAAMEAAARQFVHLAELQEAVGRKIAALLGCEAALVSAGAAS